METAVIFPAPANPRAILKPTSTYSNKTHCGAEARQTALTQAHKAGQHAGDQLSATRKARAELALETLTASLERLQHALAQQEARRRVADSRFVIARALLPLDSSSAPPNQRGEHLLVDGSAPTSDDDPGFS